MNHGTLHAYAYHGCRCDECREAAAKHRRRMRDRKRGRAFVDGPPWWCPECSRPFDDAAGLGVHRTRIHHPEHAGVTS